MSLQLGKKNSFGPKEDHMSGLRLVFIDKDTIVQNWSGVHDGKEGDPAVFKLSRVK